MSLDRRNFLQLSVIGSACLLINPISLFAKTETFKSIPEEKELAFIELRKEIAARPYNSELINTLLDFNERLGISAYKDRSMASILKFTFLNCRAPETKIRLKEAIENPMIQQKEEIDAIRKAQEEGLSVKGRILDRKKELKDYLDKEFKESFETLYYYRMTFQQEKEKEMRASLESSEKKFYPSGNEESYFKIKYYIAYGNLTEAEYSFEKIEKNIYKKIKEIESNYKRDIDAKKKEDPRKKQFKKSNKEFMLDVDTMYLAYIAGLGAFIYRESNVDKANEYSSYAKQLMGEEYSNFYYYQMHELYAMYENFNKAIENLDYIKQKDDYKELDTERFFMYFMGAQKDFENKEWRTSWINSKEGIILGLTLDYEKYYKHVISLKKILKQASVNYMSQLANTNNKDLAKSVFEETNRVMAMSKKG